MIWKWNNPALYTGSAFLFDGALHAVRTPVTVELQAALNSRTTPDQRLVSRTAIFILFWVVNEICPIKAPICLGTGGCRFGDDGNDAGFVTGNNFLTLEVAPISNHGEFFGSHSGTGVFGHGGQLVSVDANVRDSMRHDQMVFASTAVWML